MCGFNYTPRSKDVILSERKRVEGSLWWGDGSCGFCFGQVRLRIIFLPEASLSCFGKKVTKEADLGEALRLYLSGPVGFFPLLPRYKTALP